MITKEFIQETIDVWQPYSKEKLTEEDAREIIDNMTGFFALLNKWDKEQRTIQSK
jgi:hypothetical protein